MRQKCGLGGPKSEIFEKEKGFVRGKSGILGDSKRGSSLEKRESGKDRDKFWRETGKIPGIRNLGEELGNSGRSWDRECAGKGRAAAAGAALREFLGSKTPGMGAGKGFGNPGGNLDVDLGKVFPGIFSLSRGGILGGKSLEWGWGLEMAP